MRSSGRAAPALRRKTAEPAPRPRSKLASMEREQIAHAERMAEFDRKLSALGNRLGDFVQAMIRPAVLRLFRERGIALTGVSENVERSQGGDSVEVDLLVVDGDVVVAIEAKSRLKQPDIDEHLVRLASFKRYFPEYSGHKVLGAVAGMTIDKGVDRYAYRQGLFVLGQSGATIEILNDAKFKPRAW